MTITAGIDGGDESQIATNSGWGDFTRWAEGLDVKARGELVQLCEHGITEAPQVVAKQLKLALDSETPTDDVLSVGQSLLKVLQAANDGDVVFVGNGMGPA